MTVVRDFVLQLEPIAPFISAASFKLKNILLPKTESNVGLPSDSKIISFKVGVAKSIPMFAKLSIKQVSVLR